jgi:YesN/AraC family two-component response regulator
MAATQHQQTIGNQQRRTKCKSASQICVSSHAKKNTKQQNGARAHSKNTTSCTSSIDWAFNPTMQENRNMNFKPLADEIQIKLSVNGKCAKKVKDKHSFKPLVHKVDPSQAKQNVRVSLL